MSSRKSEYAKELPVKEALMRILITKSSKESKII